VRNPRKRKECSTALIIKKIVQRFIIQIPDTNTSTALMSQLSILICLKLSTQLTLKLNSQLSVSGSRRSRSNRCTCRCASRRRHRSIFRNIIKIHILKGLYQLLVVNRMLKSSITQLLVLDASKHLHMFRQQSSALLLDNPFC
jgi:hypothetical protein